MPIVNHFYHGTTRKYVALFGSLFNKMVITRDDNSAEEIQRMIVPIAYGPYQKFLARITQDPNLDRPQAISLPRMSFEIQSMNYDGSRKVNSVNKLRFPRTVSEKDFMYSPAPYNLEFNLFIMTKYSEDGTKILEQILPFFKPEYTFTVKLIEDLEPLDIPLILNGVSVEDIYEGDFETRRSLLWTLSFTMKAWFFGPIRTRSIIKLVDTRLFSSFEPDAPVDAQVIVRPGLTANGQPTSNLDESIPYDEIELGDDWGVITIIRDTIDEE